MEIWLVLAVLFLIIEFATPGLFIGTLFAVSSFVTYFVSLFVTENFWVLVIIFSLLSIFSMYFIKPILTKTLKINSTIKPSNIDALLLKNGVVTENIEPNKKGRVEVDNDSWLAQSKENEEIPKGTVVKLLTIDGNTLIVSKEMKNN